MASDPFISYLGHCLEHTDHIITALTKLLYFKDSLATLAICLSSQPLKQFLFLCTQSAVSTERSCCQDWYLTESTSFLLCRECEHFISQDIEDSEDSFRFLHVNPNFLPQILTPQGLIHDHPSISFPLSSTATVHSYFHPKVSGLNSDYNPGKLVTLTRPICIPGNSGNFLHSHYRTQRPPQEQRQGHLKDLHILPGLVVSIFLDTVGRWTRKLPGADRAIQSKWEF